MDHTDYVGIAILISSITSSVVALLAAWQALRNHNAIKEVEHKVNGVTDKLVEAAHAAGRNEAIAQRLEADVASSAAKSGK